MPKRIIQLYVSSFSGLSREIWLYSIITLVNRAGTMVIPFLSVYLTTQLGFDLSDAGILLSISGVGSVVGTWAGGKLTDRIGYFKTMFWSLILSGVMFILLLFAKSFVAIAITIFLTNMFADGFRPAGLTAISVYSTRENLTRAYSLVRLAINLGFSAGPFAAGLLAYYFSYSWMFIIDGATCIAAGFLLLLLLEDKQLIPEEEKAEIEKEGPPKSPAKDKTYLIFLLAMFFVSISFMQWFYTIPVFLKEDYLMTEDMIGAILAMNGLIIVFTEMPIIYLFENKFAKLQFISFSVILLGFGFLMFNIFPVWTIVPFIAMIFMTISEIINFPFANTWTVDRSNTLNRGSYMAYFSMTFSAGQIFAPVLGMQIAEKFGFTSLWYLAAMLCIIAYFLYSYLLRNEKSIT